MSPGLFPKTNLFSYPVNIFSPTSPITLILAISLAIVNISNSSASYLLAIATYMIAFDCPSDLVMSALDWDSAFNLIMFASFFAAFNLFRLKLSWLIPEDC
jgi:hypothetical protein